MILNFRIECNFFQNILIDIRDSPCPDSKENIIKIGVCYYADALFQLLKAPGRQFPKLKPIEIIDRDIRKKFSSTIRPTRSAYTNNKSGIFLTLFALLLSPEFKVSSEDFKNSFKFTSTNIKKYCDAVGAQRKFGGDNYQLKFPIVQKVAENKGFNRNGGARK